MKTHLLNKVAAIGILISLSTSAVAYDVNFNYAYSDLSQDIELKESTQRFTTPQHSYLISISKDSWSVGFNVADNNSSKRWANDKYQETIDDDSEQVDLFLSYQTELISWQLDASFSSQQQNLVLDRNRPNDKRPWFLLQQKQVSKYESQYLGLTAAYYLDTDHYLTNSAVNLAATIGYNDNNSQQIESQQLSQLQFHQAAEEYKQLQQLSLGEQISSTTTSNDSQWVAALNLAVDWYYEISSQAVIVSPWVNAQYGSTPSGQVSTSRHNRNNRLISRSVNLSELYQDQDQWHYGYGMALTWLISENWSLSQQYSYFDQSYWQTSVSFAF